MGYEKKIAIIGAGISGLACAYRLKQFGLRPIVLEASHRPGGVIATIRRGGLVFETGPQFPRFPPAVWRLIHELDLETEFVAGDPKAKRYIFRHGRLHPAPFSPAGLLTTQLVGWKAKSRILSEPFRYSQPSVHEESLAEFVQRKFGAEVLDNLVDPVISTIFFGDAQKMGMESAFPALVEWERRQGSLVRGALRARKSRLSKSSSSNDISRRSPVPANTKLGRLDVTDALPTLGSFKSGMATLPERLADVLKEDIRYNTQIASVVPVRTDASGSASEWQISSVEGEQFTAHHLILAIPAYAAAAVLQANFPQFAAQLGAIEYAPICTVASAYHRSQVTNNLDGFGFMVPRIERLHTICTFWNSSLFPNRAPHGTILITSFAGRELANRFEALTSEECAQTIEAENARILGISGPPLDRVVWKEARALPQYNVGHARQVAQIHATLATLPNLHLIGNFLKGRSVGECIEIASRLAEDLHSQFGD